MSWLSNLTGIHIGSGPKPITIDTSKANLTPDQAAQVQQIQNDVNNFGKQSGAHLLKGAALVGGAMLGAGALDAGIGAVGAGGAAGALGGGGGAAGLMSFLGGGGSGGGNSGGAKAPQAPPVAPYNPQAINPGVSFPEMQQFLAMQARMNGGNFGFGAPTF